MKIKHTLLIAFVGCLSGLLINSIYDSHLKDSLTLFALLVIIVLAVVFALKDELDKLREASELLASFRRFFLSGKDAPRSVLLEKYFDDLLDYYSPGKGYDLARDDEKDEKGPFAQLSTKFLKELFNHDEVRFAFCSKVRQKIKAEQLWLSMEMELWPEPSFKWLQTERSTKKTQALFALQEKISKLYLGTPLEISDSPLILVPKDGQ